MNDETGRTMQFTKERETPLTTEDVVLMVYRAMKEKGYDPVSQLVGYLISGDPTYITSHNNARYLIRRQERDELLEEFVRYYLDNKQDILEHDV